MERNIKPEDFAALAQDALVLDVRRKEVYDASNEIIAGAIWKDPAQVEQWSAEMPREQSIIVYCVHGHQISNGVLDRLHESGFANARLIEGGIEALKVISGKMVAKSS